MSRMENYLFQNIIAKVGSDFYDSIRWLVSKRHPSKILKWAQDLPLNDFLITTVDGYFQNGYWSKLNGCFHNIKITFRPILSWETD